MRDHLIDVKVGDIEDDPFESEVGNGNGEVVSCNLIQSSSLVNSIFIRLDDEFYQERRALEMEVREPEARVELVT